MIWQLEPTTSLMLYYRLFTFAFANSYPAIHLLKLTLLIDIPWIDRQVSNLNIDKSIKEAIESTEDKNEDGTDEQISAAEKSLLQKIIRNGLVETTKDIEIQRKDPSSPLYSVKSFEALHLFVSMIFLYLYVGIIQKLLIVLIFIAANQLY